MESSAGTGVYYEDADGELQLVATDMVTDSPDQSSSGVY